MAKLTINGYEDGSLYFEVTKYNYRFGGERLMDSAKCTRPSITLNVFTLVDTLSILAKFNHHGWTFNIKSATASTFHHDWNIKYNDAAGVEVLTVILPKNYRIEVQ